MIQTIKHAHVTLIQDRTKSDNDADADADADKILLICHKSYVCSINIT